MGTFGAGRPISGGHTHAPSFREFRESVHWRVSVRTPVVEAARIEGDLIEGEDLRVVDAISILSSLHLGSSFQRPAPSAPRAPRSKRRGEDKKPSL